METIVKDIAQESGIIQKTQELCQAVAEQSDFLEVKQKIDAFMGDEYLKFQYGQINELGNLLQMKQSHGDRSQGGGDCPI